MKKIIIAILLCASSAMAQTTTFYDQGNLVTITNGRVSTNAIASGITNYFKPSYGSLTANMNPFVVASSVSVTNGTITSGTVTNTWIDNASYLVVNESGVFEVYFFFTNAATCPRILDFNGHYDGNPSHYVKFQAWDYTNSVYSNLTANVTDVPNGTVDVSRKINFPDPNQNYCNTNGEVIIRALHIGTAVGSHNMYFDFMQLTYATAIATNAGVWYPLTGFQVSQSNNITTDGANGRIITTSAGDYEWSWFLSFTGLTNTQFDIQHLTNGVTSSTKSIRTIGSVPQIGSMSAFGGGRQPSGCTNSWQYKADTENAFIVFVNGTAKVKKESN